MLQNPIPASRPRWPTDRVGMLAMAAVSLCTPAFAQEPQDASRAEAYARIAELPPFDGVWSPDWGKVTQLRAAEGKAPLTAEARAELDAFNAAKTEGANLQTAGANCIPSGLPGAMRYPYPIEFIYSPGKVNIVIETNSQLRQIFTDGRAFPDDPDLLFNGTSIGRWDGDALEVETIGLTPQISILAGIHPTEATRVHERMSLEGPDKLLIVTTITDPALFTQPFVTELTYSREPDWDIREYVCQENNRDAADAEGRPSMDLGIEDAFQ